MRVRTAWLSGAATGAAVAFFLDATSGRRRRKRLVDALLHSAHVTAHTTGRFGRDLRNRSRGLAATTGRLFRRDEPSDEVLVERVRAALGRVASHPRAIEVTAEDGCVTLRGPILRTERDDVIEAVKHVRGVRNVAAQFDVYADAAKVAALEGGEAESRQVRRFTLPV